MELSQTRTNWLGVVALLVAVFSVAFSQMRWQIELPITFVGTTIGLVGLYLSQKGGRSKLITAVATAVNLMALLYCLADNYR